MLNTWMIHLIKYHGKPNITFRDQGFRRGLVAKSIRLDIERRDASWKTAIKHAAIREARRTPDNVTPVDGLLLKSRQPKSSLKLFARVGRPSFMTDPLLRSLCVATETDLFRELVILHTSTTREKGSLESEKQCF